MQTQRVWFNCLGIGFGLSAIGVFGGCAKVQTIRINTTSNLTTQATMASDVVTVNNEFDNALDDAVTVLCNHNATMAHALADSLSPYVYEIDYYGKETNVSKSRAGNDSIHLGAIPWDTPGATANVSFGDLNNSEYEVSFLTNNTSLRLTGIASITNVYGGLLQNLASGDSLVVHIKATIAFTYNDQTTGAQTFTWYLNQLRSFTRLNDTTLYASARGDTVLSGVSGTGTWGTSRLGNAFYAVITGKVIQNISNPPLSYNPMSGTETIGGITEPILSTYGVNNQGSAITSGTPYGFLITWYNEGHAADVIPYYY